MPIGLAGYSGRLEDRGQVAGLNVPRCGFAPMGAPSGPVGGRLKFILENGWAGMGVGWGAGGFRDWVVEILHFILI